MKLAALRERPQLQQLQNAYIILSNAHDTASSFLEIFELTRKNRRARGTPTDEEQDLLRAMLIFATSGLDSMVKQLIRDALPDIIKRNEGAARMLKQFVEKQIRKKDNIDHRFIAEIISDLDPHQKLIQSLLYDLTSGSIQSVDQLFKVCSFFDIPSKNITDEELRLKAIFNVRNQIAHEMDIHFDQPNRNRRPRAKQDMIDNTNFILEIASNVLSETENKLKV